MKVMISTLCGLLVVGLSQTALAAPPANAGATSTTYTTLAAKAQAAGQAEVALFFQEQALVASVDQPAVFGPATGRYWQTIRQDGAWSRAYSFFSRLAAQHPDDSDVLANYGNAVGGLLGELVPSYGNELPPGFLQKLNTHAMQAYSHALNIQPDNFAALLGQAIFLSYTPGGMAKAEAGFKHILSLRKSHSHYPYALVYEQWAAALTRGGHKAEANNVMKKGKAALGAAAFSKGSGHRH